MNSPQNICKNCRFWTGNRKASGSGSCRRYPPMAAGVIPIQTLSSRQPQPGIICGTPDTQGEYWCGEFVAELLQ